MFQSQSSGSLAADRDLLTSLGQWATKTKRPYPGSLGRPHAQGSEVAAAIRESDDVAIDEKGRVDGLTTVKNYGL
jgi:hypothetical protein